MKRGIARKELATVSASRQVPAVGLVYQAKLQIPCAVLGIRTHAEHVIGLEFLPLSETTLQPQDEFTRAVCAQLLAYVRNADFQFDVPLLLTGTAHQSKVWQALRSIPCGEARTYGDLAHQLGSSPRAVGGACGDNPMPLFIPCHRVVAKHGEGGFMHHASGDPLAIKAWLLRHEGWQR